jgi:hypothetical protein
MFNLFLPHTPLRSLRLGESNLFFSLGKALSAQSV